MMLTNAQRELLEDKFVLWDRASREGNMELRDYNRRAAEALKVALSICSSAPEPGYEVEPVAKRKHPLWLNDLIDSLRILGRPDKGLIFTSRDSFTGSARFEIHGENARQVNWLVMHAKEIADELEGSLYASREEVAEEIWRRFAPSYEETFAECANRSEYLLAADSILQRLSNQQGGQ